MIQFLADNALSVLNPVMAACKAMCDAGHGVEGSTIVLLLIALKAWGWERPAAA